jgi:hypothetical protein
VDLPGVGMCRIGRRTGMVLRDLSRP